MPLKPKILERDALIPAFKTGSASRTLINRYLESTSTIEVASDADYRLAECDALLNLSRNAVDKGANAIVGLRKTHAHYDQPGSQWRVSRVIYSGTAAVVT